MSDGEASAKLGDLKPAESGLQAPPGADFRKPAGVISNDVSLEELSLTDEHGVACGEFGCSKLCRYVAAASAVPIVGTRWWLRLASSLLSGLRLVTSYVRLKGSATDLGQGMDVCGQPCGPAFAPRASRRGYRARPARCAVPQALGAPPCPNPRLHHAARRQSARS